jgi:PAS domain S-box-containing protein
MWDIATPIIVGGQHVGNIFLGQFFFEGEPIDYELFRSQARQYGFNEEKYIAELEKVPRLSREVVNTIMAFFMKLSNMLSHLGYSNIKLTQSLAERDTLLEALRKSESKYRHIIETSQEGVWIIDRNDLTVFANQIFSEMLGYSIDEIIGQPPQKFLSLEFITVADDRLREHRQRVRQAIDYRLIKKDGSDLWCIVSTHQLSDDEGKYSGSLGMLTDITERKHAEEALIRSEERFRKVFNQAATGIAIHNLETGCQEVNNRLCDITGYSREELISKSPYMLVHPDDQEEFAAEINSFQKGETSYFVKEMRNIRADGRIIWVRLNASFLNYSGISKDSQPTVINIMEDITELKKAEEALKLSNLYNRSLIEACLDPLVTIGYDGKITDVNGATEQVTEYSRNELIKTDFSDYFTEPEKARKGYQQVFTDGEVRNYPLEIQHQDGHITPVLYNASVYRDENGEIIGIFASARDITERKHAEEVLKKAHHHLEVKVKERTEELEKAYNSLKESEGRLAEAQKMAHIGNWEWDVATDKAYWSEEMYCIFKRDPQKLAPSLNEYLSYIHPDDLDYYCKVNDYTRKVRTSGLDFRIVLANGEERTLHIKSDFIFNDENIPIRVKGIVQDITESKKADEKIQTLAKAVESSNDAIVTEAFDNTIASWNKAAEQIYGYSAQEILGKNVSILEPDNIKGEIKRFSEKIIQGEKIQHYETSRLKKDGTIINVSVTLSPIFGESGKLVALSAIVRDITEHKRAEEALRESEARLRRFYESGMFGVLYYNLDGTITDANDKFLEIVGFTREDLQAGQVNWNKMTPPEYRLLDEHCIAELKSKGLKAPYEKEYIRKDGSRVPIILGIATFDQEGLEGIAFVIDITKNKQGEHRIRRYYNILEGINRIFGSVVRAETEEELGNVCLSVALEVTESQVGFAGEVGVGGILNGITVSNMEWAQKLMYETDGNHRPLGDFVLHDIYGRIVDSGKSFFTNDLPSQPNSMGLTDSHLQLASLLGVPLVSEGKTIGLIAVANREGGYSCEQQEDLEAIAPAVIQALQRKRGEKVMAEIDKIRIKEIHHRIKNNLQVISSLLDLQAEKFIYKRISPTPEVLKAFKESQDRIISMALIHEELYKGGGDDTLDFSAYLRKLAENLFQTYIISSKNVRLCMNLEENALFDMDVAVPLGIIVNELISNSLKHAFLNRYGGEIRIRLRREEKNNEISKSLFSLTVSDNGKGIPDNLELENLESLGLQLVNILVDQLDGEIELKREHGTEFRITFNVAERS